MPSPTPTRSSQYIHVGSGVINGIDDQFTNPYSIHDKHDGDTAQGGHGSPVDGVTCDPTMSDNYHVHVALFLYVNGSQIALPDGIGMAEPGVDGSFAGLPNQTEYTTPPNCFYHLHTHDASGAIHIEDPNPLNLPLTASMYSLQTLFDIFGVTVNGLQFGPYTGPVQVITSGQQSRGATNGAVVYSDTYSVYTGDPNGIPLYSHEVIWIMVGTGNPTIDQLPNVKFYTEW